MRLSGFASFPHQIRDALIALAPADEHDMLAIQLDDRALFVEGWRDFFLEALDDEPLKRAIADGWTGRASVDSVGYRVVRELRVAVYGAVLAAVTKEAAAADARFSVW